MIFPRRQLVPPSGAQIRSVLFDGLGTAPDPLALDGANWSRHTVAEVDHRHLAGLAAAFLQGHGVAASDEVREEIRRLALVEAAGVASVVASAGRGLDALTSAAIPFIVVKGAAIARLYAGGLARYMGDVDVLVAPADFQSAYDCLVALGGRTYTDSMRFSAAVAPSVNVTDESGLQIDLHRAMAPWHWARRLSFDRLCEGSMPVDLGGRSVPATNLVHALLITAASMVSDCATPHEKTLPWRDVALLLQAVEQEQRVDMLVDEAEATDTGWMLKLVLDALPPTIRPRDVSDRLASPSRGQRASLAVVHNPRIARRQWAFVFLRWPFRRVVAFERGMFWPSRASLHSQGYKSRRSFVQELVKELQSN
jgi:hypothetical protein